MNLLAIETSSEQGSLALWSSTNLQQPLAHSTWLRPASHSELVTLELEKLLASCQLSVRKLSHIAVGLGPGSFTGIRVGLSLGRSLAFALNLPIIGLNSLKLLLKPTARPGPYICLVPAVQGFYYLAAYLKQSMDLQFSETRTIYDPCVVSKENLFIKIKALKANSSGSEPLTLLGRGFQWNTLFASSEWHDLVIGDPHWPNYPSALDLGQVVVNDLNSVHFSSWHKLNPLYLRASEADEKLRQGLLKPLPKL